MFTYQEMQEASDYILNNIGDQPKLGIILGSALGPFAEEIENKVVIDYTEIPHFLKTTVKGHAGKLIYGNVGDKKVICMSGRFHYYEGYDFEQLDLPIRIFKLLGVETVILTNASGGVNVEYKPGDIMIISDHIKLMGASPLRGSNKDEFGPRYPDSTFIYTPELREIALKCAEGSDLTIHEGVYMYMPGPQFETPAEIRAIRILGGDAVGMSTVTEAITATHCGMKVLGLSIITNMAAGILNRKLTDEEVYETGKTISTRFSEYVKKIIEVL